MKILVYAIFLAIPFGNSWGVFHIVPVEAPVLIGIVLFPFAWKNRATTRFTLLDGLVLAYAFLNLIAVVLGMESLYDSAWYYRHMVLTPALIYLFVRTIKLSLPEVRKAMLMTVPGVFLQGLLFLRFYLVHHTRPTGVEGAGSSITLAVFFFMALLMTIFLFSAKGRIVMKGLKAILLVGFGTMLLVTMSRIPILSFVFVVPFINRIWKSLRIRRLSGAMMFGVPCLLLLLMITGMALPKKASNLWGKEGTYEQRHSLARVYSFRQYISDTRERFAAWGKLMKVAFEHPVLGSGASSHDPSNFIGGQFPLHSAHNILISSLMTSGVVGLTILLLTIKSAYNLLNRFPRNNIEIDAIGKVLWLSLTILLLVGCTNDFSGGRILIWLSVLSMIAKLATDFGEQVENEKKY